MAALVRIKRRFTEEPTDSIVVKPKRLRVEGAAAADLKDVSPAILERIATVNSKDDELKPELLQAFERKYRNNKLELQENFKKLGNVEGFRDVAKREAKERTKKNRYMIVDAFRGHINDTEPEGIEGQPKVKQDKKKDLQESDGNGEMNSAQSTIKVKYFDAELQAEDVEDVITCNGVPLESEKYVYDIFYSPMDIGWTEYICDVQKYDNELSDDGPELSDGYDDEDDENEESNWRNDYPEEEESPYEDEDDYLCKQLQRLHTKHSDSDESFDADEYADGDFDEDGNYVY
ncbi:hypothetical protein OTU49_005843 [Cherax quadricarinatus]|uniref:RNA polymerase II nuclear localization protein SLC7A6OS n=2 Tax=Cherax quadricarinatus TaxID=27406 RepID=A0AAW0X5S1_CHEQU|nr:probable RNA polymerase II nuclear localization protein SLC7A6OS [Cherax quadricarinatus]